ncbi:MAG TPA: hypothetical protein VGF45_16055 [Polyangia bacterium]
MSARTISAALGIWLCASAFLWEHSAAQFHNAWIVGVLAVVGALASLQGVRGARFVDVAVGGWLLVTAVALPSNPLTFWNHIFVGLALATFGATTTVKAFAERDRVPIGGKPAKG